MDGLLHAADTVLSEDNLVTHARDSEAKVFIITLDVVEEYFLVLQLVLQRFQIGLFLLLSLHLLRIRVQTFVKLSSFFRFFLLVLLCGTLITSHLGLSFTNLFVNFRLYFLQLLLCLSIVVGEDHELLSLVLQQLRVVVCLQL